MKTLKLVLKKQWFDMIASGEKTEEYREIKTYWQKRLCKFCVPPFCTSCCYECYDNFANILGNYSRYDVITFYLGCQKNRPQMTFEIKALYVNGGDAKWGAEKGKYYFVIKLGKRIDNL